MAEVGFDGVWKEYDSDSVAVKDLTIHVETGEFVVLVGPSGCGKTTSLRMLAGLEEITEGTISIDGVVVNDLPPKARGIGMVFQSYALYPHMNVERNLSFGLRMQKGSERLEKKEIDSRVSDAAELLGLTEYLDRLPKNLSGGQRQRVALGRALVRQPEVLLMDEPLSNLDAKLRNQMRIELRRLHEELGTTTIYVTHDQVEAMTLADRIVIMNEGRMQQFSTPLEAYHRPSNTFVASFLGTPPMNLVEGSMSDGVFIATDANARGEPFTMKMPSHHSSYEGRCTLGFRPENTALKIGDEDGKFKIAGFESLGSETIVHLDHGDIRISAVWHRPGPEANRQIMDRTSNVGVQINESDVRLFDSEGNAVNEA
ncbi:MAG: glycerol-3-phosphate ABC transporter ATP-binding protein [Pedosphaera sp.]|nr:glycerol-3-phosphate ABC transporter ATP-binding protein [Pedosphaera sp.]